MNPTEIYDALSEIAAKPFNASEFPFEFALATDAAQAAVAKLRAGTTNKSDLPSGVLFNKKFHYAPALGGMVAITLDQLKASKKNASAKPAILLTTDGETIAALHPASGESLHCKFAELGDHFGFFLPAAGKERYKAVEENPVDIKATGKLARLYDALIKANPDWATAERRHEMNQLMMRIIFCLFSEDVGIFAENQFSKAIFTHAGDKGEETREVLISAFRAMNLPQGSRGDLPAWTHDLEYVNGGLFAGSIDAPRFDTIAFRYFKEAASLNWREINPDIFGSMIQSVADPEKRSELGMHYTSVPNIMKVIGPLFLDDIDADIEKSWDKPKALQQIIQRLGNIRVFDPACGSGNFLVVAYRQLRERELKVYERLEALKGNYAREMFSAISLKNFYGIEITDFGVETAKLALFIAEYQANALFQTVFGKTVAALPLKEAANIVHGNALRLDWEEVCPPPSGEQEVYIAGNPPFLGDGSRSDEQNADMDYVFSGEVDAYRRVDFVACWFFKASKYIRGRHAQSALVSTNSICQGQAVGALWPSILKDDILINFAHKSFKWSNNASANAAVICVIVGLKNKPSKKKVLFDGNTINEAHNINAYLIDGPNMFIDAEPKSIFNLPYMEYGNKPTDGGFLILSPEERSELLSEAPESSWFIKRYMGSQEVVKGIERFCIWVSDQDATTASQIPFLKQRFDQVAKFRAASKAAQTRPWAAYPYKFRQAQNWAKQSAILVPSVTSERRPYLPVALVGADVISSNLNQVLYDAPEWCIALIASKLHLVWIATVCGKLKSDFRYSNTLGWNTFPVPKFTEAQLEALTASARKILKTRYLHHPKTIADLYDPDKMPDDLREAHRENDELLETMYIGRPFRNDSERLEHLFKLYAAKMKSLGK
ncbi:class I SAM-dependent DNA methyltransferase [Brevundimonas sp.]|uniref:class I SAM-dependent DNA methyltransferase n=1 Tax=Brevundimonas sp. TaxID=1871086 RepID=UPI00289F4772|nr:DNA methyltransferase [Brevundimonas sp.]